MHATCSTEIAMRYLKHLTTLATTLLLCSCVSSLLVGNQLQSRLMWAFMEPLVGFNPNDINFFEAPIIKDRMTALLGDKYEPTMRLLRTANQIQQEGALYYVASRYAPQEVRDVADAAGLVWNSDTNQMAVMLVQDGVPDLLAEQAQDAAAAFVQPVLPTELKSVYEKAVAARAAVEGQQQRLEEASAILGGDLGERLEQRTTGLVEERVGAAVDEEVEDAEAALQDTVEEHADDLYDDADDPLLELIRQRNL
jgi:hypothetical protein